MKVNIIFFAIVLLWVLLTGFTGYYINIFMHTWGANFITPQDVIGCYVLPAVIYGMLGFILFLTLIKKIK